MKMVSWLDNFAQERVKSTMKKTASKIIVNKEDFATARNNDIVEYKGEKYKVVDSKFSDKNGPGVVLEKCASLENENPMDIAIGTSNAFSEFSNKAQEYAYNDPQINDEDPRDEEVSKFEADADETARQIEMENSIDGTSGATRPNRILQKMFESYVNENSDNGDGNSNRFKIVDKGDERVIEPVDDIVDLETFDFDKEDINIEENNIDEKSIDNIKVVSNRIFNKLKK